MRHTTPDEERNCALADRCRAYDPIDKHPAVAESARDPLCKVCHTANQRDIRLLRFDWLDLEQLQLPAMPQLWDTNRGGTAGPPMPLRGEPEALQAEIAHVLQTWEHILRRRHRLTRLSVGAIVGAWHTSKSNPPPPPRVRPGLAVRRALDVIGPRIQELAKVPPAAVLTWTRDEHVDFASLNEVEASGLDAIDQLVHLHLRARAMLGRTRRTFWVPGDCWQEACGDAHRKAVAAGTAQHETRYLYRSEPLDEGDEPPVWCLYCDEPRTEREYRFYIEMLVWPAKWYGQEAAA